MGWEWLSLIVFGENLEQVYSIHIKVTITRCLSIHLHKIICDCHHPQVFIGHILPSSGSSCLRPIVHRLSHLFQGFFYIKKFSIPISRWCFFTSESLLFSILQYIARPWIVTFSPANWLWSCDRADDESNCSGKIPGTTQGKIDLRNESGRPMKVKVVGEVSEKWN